jgi:hypothetical protein
MLINFAIRKQFHFHKGRKLCSVNALLSTSCSFESVGSDDAPNVILFIHGLLGSKKNFRTVDVTIV